MKALVALFKRSTSETAGTSSNQTPLEHPNFWMYQ